MVVFVSTPWVWVSFCAALAAGVSCLLANSMTRTLLSQTAGSTQASVMAVWAIAWAGSKPLASLTDGLLAGWIGVWPTGMILAIPAFIPIAAQLAVHAGTRNQAAHPSQTAPTRTAICAALSVIPSPQSPNRTDDNKARVTHNRLCCTASSRPA